MKVTIIRWAIILIPIETAVLLIGINMSKEASDLAMGIILGLAFVLVAFIIGWFVRTGVQDRQRQEAKQRWQRPVQQEAIDAEWRDWHGKSPATPTVVIMRNGKQIEPPKPTQALVKRYQT